MSKYFPNISVEQNMTKVFICTLYANTQKDSNIERYGMNPFDIWKKMKRHGFLEPIVPTIINKLIINGIEKRFLRFDKDTKLVMITPQGKQWCEDINYRTIPGVFD
ncbi:MAG: hypothetical protein ACPKPY_09840 [Nitrososphaeraceae archaeon]